MANMKLTIQHDNTLYEPPIKDGVKLEWERTGVPGKLTFTVLKTSELNFAEGDPVCFYYDDKKVFMGYVFKKKRDREHHIEVTCYDQLRYLKNKYTYVFEKKTASQIVKALCNDFGLSTGTIDNTNYVISAIAEENKSAFDITLSVLEDTLLNTGNMFVLYDDFGKIQLKNCANMISTTLIMEDTAENFDYTSSIDDETYNQVVLYYKNDKEIQQIYTASSPSTIKQWGTLRYFEEVKSPTIGQNKANSLLKLYNKKTRELKVNGAFGDISVRGGTLIPVKLNLGDITTNNYMLVKSVTHNFENNRHIMDLTLEGAWEDGYTSDMVSKTVGEIKTTTDSNSSNTNSNSSNIPIVENSLSDKMRAEQNAKAAAEDCYVVINCNGINSYAGLVNIWAYAPASTNRNGSRDTYATRNYQKLTRTVALGLRRGCRVEVKIRPIKGHKVKISDISNQFKFIEKRVNHSGKDKYQDYEYVYEIDGISRDARLTVKWVK